MKQDKEQQSRKWICEKLLTGKRAIMKMIIADLQFNNIRAAHKAVSRQSHLIKPETLSIAPFQAQVQAS
jgi:hypothetical protein